MDLKGWPDMSLSCVFSLSKKLYIFPSEREVRMSWLAQFTGKDNKFSRK